MSENVEALGGHSQSTDEQHPTTTTVQSFLVETPGHWEITLKASTAGVPTILMKTAVGVLKHTVRVEPRTVDDETVYAVDETHSARSDYVALEKFRVLKNALQEAQEHLERLEETNE
jgi:hypothetical protein